MNKGLIIVILIMLICAVLGFLFPDFEIVYSGSWAFYNSTFILFICFEIWRVVLFGGVSGIESEGLIPFIKRKIKEQKNNK